MHCIKDVFNVNEVTNKIGRRAVLSTGLVGIATGGNCRDSLSFSHNICVLTFVCSHNHRFDIDYMFALL